MKYFLKNLIFFLLRIFFGRLNGASILMYHSIAKNNAFFTVDPDDFEWQMRYLKEKKINVLKLSELIEKVRRKEKLKNVACITFDDGYEDNYLNAFPILKKYEFPATVFVATALIGTKLNDFQMLSEQQMLEMQKSGIIDFMPHTHSHTKLHKIPIDEAINEISRSKNVIEKTTGKISRILAYPMGRFNNEVLNYLKANSWLGAVTVAGGVISEDDDVFKLKRNSVDSTTSMIQFKAKLSDAIGIYNKARLWIKK